MIKDILQQQIDRASAKYSGRVLAVTPFIVRNEGMSLPAVAQLAGETYAGIDDRQTTDGAARRTAIAGAFDVLAAAERISLGGNASQIVATAETAATYYKDLGSDVFLFRGSAFVGADSRGVQFSDQMRLAHVRFLATEGPEDKRADYQTVIKDAKREEKRSARADRFFHARMTARRVLLGY